MNDPLVEVAEAEQVATATDSPSPASKPRPKIALPTEAELLAKLFWNVGEVAFIARVSARSVWRMVADPKSGFPKPRRLGGRTLFPRDAVLAFLGKGASR